MASMEKELWEMDLEIIRLSKHVLGETKMHNMPEQSCLPHPDCPLSPKLETAAVIPSTREDITCKDHVKTLEVPPKTDSSITVESKKLPKKNILQRPHTDIFTQLEKRDKFGFELCQFEKILVEISKNRISFNKQMKLLLTDIAALPKVTQGTRLNTIKTKVTTHRNQSKRLSYEGRQLLESIQNDLWDMDLQIIQARGHCDIDVRREVLPVQSCLPHPDGPPITFNTSVAYKKWNHEVSDGANDEDVNLAVTSLTASASANFRSSRERIATIKRQTLCFRNVLKRPVSAPCLFKLAKKRKRMMPVTNISIASTSADKLDTTGKQVLVRPTKKDTVETDTNQKSFHEKSSHVIHVNLKQKKKVHATSASNISHSTFRKSENTKTATHVKLTKRKKVTSATNSSYISSESENPESTINSKQFSLTQKEANPSATDESHIFSKCTLRATAARLDLMQEEPLTAPTSPSFCFCSSDELQKKSCSSASQVKLTRKLSTDSTTYEIRGRARPSTLLTPQTKTMFSASFSIPGFSPTFGVGDGHTLTPVTMADADLWNGTPQKTQEKPLTAPTERSVTGETLTGSHRNIGLKEAQTILEILKMQRDLLVTSIRGIRSELDLGKHEDSLWRRRMDELDTELRQIKRCPNSHRLASIRAKAAYLKVQMSNLQLWGNVYLNSMDSVISHLTGEIRCVSCKIMAASPFTTDVNIFSRD
ncbi:uncharacterized protein [Haliotis asinina]|uniref:uncharacterized protein n=1 Tax=Haliotis asinina TaxID=109174 RepID=UPI003531E510